MATTKEESFRAKCDDFADKLQDQLNRVNNLVKVPAILIHHMNRIAKKLTTDVMNDFTNKTMGEINGVVDKLPNFAPTLLQVEDMLNAMGGCAEALGLGGVDHQINLAKSVIGKCSSFANVPSFVKDLLNKYIIASALSKVNEFLDNNIFGQISKLSLAYSRFLQASGLMDALSMMDSILNKCIKGTCDAAGSFSEAIDKYGEEMDRLEGIYKWDKKANGDFSVKNAASKVIDTVDAKTKTYIDNSMEYVEKKYTSIKEYDFGLQEVHKDFPWRAKGTSK